MKLFMIAFVAILIAATQVNAQTRGDERHPTRLPVNVIVDKTSADGNWMKVYEVGGGMHDDLITELFIADDSGINTDELDRLDLVEKYQLLFGLSEMVPHGLITLIAEQQAKELEMADWELVGTPQLQGEDCLMPGENPPPVWPQDINLPPCPEPEPEPIGKEPNPPEPTPPSDGKPLPEPVCWSEVDASWAVFVWDIYADYECNNFKGSFELKDWSDNMWFQTTVINGTLNLTLGFWKAGGWVYLLEGKNTPLSAEDNNHYYWHSINSNKWTGGQIRKVEVSGTPNPEALYNWRLGIDKTTLFTLFTLFKENFLYPSWPCVVDDSIPKPAWSEGC